MKSQIRLRDRNCKSVVVWSLVRTLKLKFSALNILRLAPSVRATVMGKILLMFIINISGFIDHRCNENLEKAGGPGESGGVKIMSNMLVIFVAMLSLVFH